MAAVRARFPGWRPTGVREVDDQGRLQLVVLLPVGDLARGKTVYLTASPERSRSRRAAGWLAPHLSLLRRPVDQGVLGTPQDHPQQVIAVGGRHFASGQRSVHAIL